MALEEYKAKRKLDKRPEPRGGSSKKNRLQFVIQKHAASHLHYDFRLEMRGEWDLYYYQSSTSR